MCTATNRSCRVFGCIYIGVLARFRLVHTYWRRETVYYLICFRCRELMSDQLPPQYPNHPPPPTNAALMSRRQSEHPLGRLRAIEATILLAL